MISLELKTASYIGKLGSEARVPPSLQGIGRVQKGEGGWSDNNVGLQKLRTGVWGNKET